MIGAQFFPAVYPWRHGRRLTATIDQDARPYNRGVQAGAVRSALVSGMEGYDYQNPYVWTAAAMPHHSDIPPRIRRADTAANVARNIAAGRGALGD